MRKNIAFIFFSMLFALLVVSCPSPDADIPEQPKTGIKISVEGGGYLDELLISLRSDSGYSSTQNFKNNNRYFEFEVPSGIYSITVSGKSSIEEYEGVAESVEVSTGSMTAVNISLKLKTEDIPEEPEYGRLKVVVNGVKNVNLSDISISIEGPAGFETDYIYQLGERTYSQVPVGKYKAIGSATGNDGFNYSSSAVVDVTEDEESLLEILWQKLIPATLVYTIKTEPEVELNNISLQINSETYKEQKGEVELPSLGNYYVFISANGPEESEYEYSGNVIVDEEKTEKEFILSKVTEMEGQEKKYGSVCFVISDDIKATGSGVFSPVDMDVVRYSVNGARLNESVEKGTDLTLKTEVGTWNFQVYAHNASGDIIGYSLVEDIVIEENSLVQKEVFVSEIQGTGSLNVDITLLDDGRDDYHAYIVKDGLKEIIELESTTQGRVLKAEKSGLENGFYNLYILAGTDIMAVKTFRIVSSRVTDIVYSLEEDYGRLMFDIEDNVSVVGENDVISPVLLQVDSYDIKVLKDTEEIFSRNNISPSEAETIYKFMKPDTYSVSVEAENRDGVIIGEGTVSATIKAGENISAMVNVLPLEGKGTLNIAINTDRLDSTGLLSVAVREVSSNDEIDVPLSNGGSGLIYSGSVELDSGKYELAIKVEEEVRNRISFLVIADQETKIEHGLSLPSLYSSVKFSVINNIRPNTADVVGPDMDVEKIILSASGPNDSKFEEEISSFQFEKELLKGNWNFTLNAQNKAGNTISSITKVINITEDERSETFELEENEGLGNLALRVISSSDKLYLKIGQGDMIALTKDGNDFIHNLQLNNGIYTVCFYETEDSSDLVGEVKIRIVADDTTSLTTDVSGIPEGKFRVLFSFENNIENDRSGYLTPIEMTIDSYVLYLNGVQQESYTLDLDSGNYSYKVEAFNKEKEIVAVKEGTLNLGLDRITRENIVFEEENGDAALTLSFHVEGNGDWHVGSDAAFSVDIFNENNERIRTIEEFASNGDDLTSTLIFENGFYRAEVFESGELIDIFSFRIVADKDFRIQKYYKVFHDGTLVIEDDIVGDGNFSIKGEKESYSSSEMLVLSIDGLEDGMSPTWSLNGQIIGTEASINYALSSLSEGSYPLLVQIKKENIIVGLLAFIVKVTG